MSTTYTLRYRIDDEYIKDWDGDWFDERPHLHPQVAADNVTRNTISSDMPWGRTLTVELYEDAGDQEEGTYFNLYTAEPIETASYTWPQRSSL